ncbi:NAD(P)H-hydrate epimerase [Adlercreutzia sp. ZJ141]|uniref:NAD(P)H-hydrate epimerase n=1 Tax=Adlercreutzia sp. ZJ141 TaxID=2709406 RepID=UPI0013EBAF7E|nr:NAD(P)H-hydrate epimerase [Adlercreutzia sp. ZJ141]
MCEMKRCWEYEEGMLLLDVANVVALEQRIAADGTPLRELMQHAGEALAEAAAALAPSGHIVVLAGNGNNGGDGWVAASLMAGEGREVTLVSKMAPADLVAEPARTAAIEAVANGGFSIVLSPSGTELRELLCGAALVIDAILGTGFSHDHVREPYDAWIAAANEARRTHGVAVLAADVPSGLSAQTGMRASTCIAADATVTMLAAKPGLLHAEAKPYVGRLLFAPLGNFATVR